MLYYLSARAPPTDESGEKKFDPLSSPPRPSFPSGVMNCGGELSDLSPVEFDHSQQSVRFSSSPERHQSRPILLPPHASSMLCFSSFHGAQKYESLFPQLSAGPIPSWPLLSSEKAQKRWGGDLLCFFSPFRPLPLPLPLELGKL